MPTRPAPARSGVDIIGAGVTKCGSTSIWRILTGQAWFSASRIKEPAYFDRNFDRGAAWYENLWPEPRDTRLRGEFSPSYLRHSEAAARMREHSPDARIVIILREPVARAVSHFRMLRRNGLTGGADLDEILRDGTHDELRDRIVDPGEYATGLRRLLEHFPREQVHVMVLERVVARPRAELRGLLDHVAPGRPQNIPETLPRTNEAFTPRFPMLDRQLAGLRRSAISAQRFRTARRIGAIRRSLPQRPTASEPEVPQSARMHLSAHYAEETASLRALLGDPLAEWSR